MATALRGRTVTTLVTLAVLALIVVLLGWWGIKEVTKPFPNERASSSPTCTEAEKTHTLYVKPKDVTVSVYNAGARQGFASLTLQRLERAGFHPGEVANAPGGTTVPKAKVLTTKENDPAAELVAKTLGKDIPIEVTDEVYGPGIDVLVGKKLHRLNPKAPSRVKLPHPVTTCVRVS